MAKAKAEPKTKTKAPRTQEQLEEDKRKLLADAEGKLTGARGKLQNFEGGDTIISKYQEIINEIKKIDASAADAEQQLKKLKEQLKETGREVKGLTNTKQKGIVDNSKITGEMAQLAQFMQKNSGASREWKNQLENCYAVLKNLSKQGNVTNETFEAVKTTIRQTEAEMRRAGQTGISMWDRMGRSLKSQIAQQAAMYLSLQDFIRYARQLVSTVTEVDTALTELRKVSDASDTRLSQSFKKSAETAKELGATISNVINSTSDWARMGYSVDQAEELARVTTLYQNVGDNIDQQTASENLISALQGFQISADESERVIDKFNEVNLAAS